MGGISFAPVPGTGGKYTADSEGNIYGTRGRMTLGPRTSSKRRFQPGRGHLGVTLRVDGEQWSGSVHRLVYEAFHGDITEGLMVRHRDGDPSNNALPNLELGTQSDNMLDAVRHGTVTPPTMHGEANGAARLSAEEVAEIRALHAAGGVTQHALGDRFGVSGSLISLIVRGKLWKEIA